MPNLEKTTRPRFGSDWDLDLGWVLLWWGVLTAVVFVVYFICSSCVKANLANVTRDEFYARTCKTVFEIPNNGGRAYQCQNK
jgi:hypothetical protein